VQHGDEADLGTQVPGIGGDGLERRGGGPEQDVVDHALVLQGDGGDRFGDGEDDVEIGHRQQVGLARLEPFGPRQGLALRTVPITAAVI
jgi:hypothetical protein